MRKTLRGALIVLVLAVPFTARADKVGGGDVTFKPKNADAVLFSHEQHVNVKSLKCTACHYQLFQMTRGSYKMDMTKITKGDFCGKCHNGQRAFDVKEKANCARCHR